jgi:hypothetical protein
LGPALAAQQPSSDAPRQHIISGELTHAIDAKKAKVGDKVTLRLVDNILSNGKIIVPYRNGKVIGHITEVRPATKENPQSMVAIEFDRIEAKGGTALPITAVIQSMTPPDHHMIRSSSGIPTSGDDPAARAAGPMVDSNGHQVLPPPAPLSQPGPHAAASDWKSSGSDDMQFEASLATHTTVITSGKKSLYVESDTRIRLAASSTAF